MKKLMLLAGMVLLMACKKEDSDPTDPIPGIKLISIGPAKVVEFKDSVQVVISYQDGDGDLGGVHPDSSNLFIVDKRINVPFEFRIQELVPGGATVPIAGTLKVIIQNLFLTGSGNSEQVSFDIYAIDKAGHTSNTVTTEPIEVVKS